MNNKQNKINSIKICASDSIFSALKKMDETFKRLLLVFDGDKFTFVELGVRKITRINVLGNIVDRYDNEGDSKYTFLTLDDGSGQIQLRIFGDDVEKYKDITQGKTVLIVGLLRSFNNATYIAPEIIKEQDPKYLLVRKLEIEQEKSSAAEPIPREQIVAVKDRILGSIKNSEEDGGIDVDKIILSLQDLSPEIINQEIQKFIEEGIVFEPRPGRVRYLG